MFNANYLKIPFVHAYFSHVQILIHFDELEYNLQKNCINVTKP